MYDRSENLHIPVNATKQKKFCLDGHIGRDLHVHGKWFSLHTPHQLTIVRKVSPKGHCYLGINS